MVLTVLGQLVSLLAPREARAAGDKLCRAAPAIETTASTDALLTAADALSSPLDRARGRALYLAVLAREPEDEEAAVGLARLDAADGCYALAAKGYRDVLARSPGNVDARAGLADVLVWTGKWKEADEVLRDGLVYAPLSPDLLSRRARVAHFRGDPAAARRYLNEAARVSPLDPEVRVARERVFLGQLRLGQRVQIFPSSHDDLYTTDTSGMLRWQRLRFEVGASVVTRYGATRSTRSGPTRTTLIDGRPMFGTFYHFDSGAWAGGSVGISVPALALPRYALSLSGFTPLGRIFSAQLTTSFWTYSDRRDVIVVSPALGAAITDSIDAVVRYWFTAVSGPGGTGATTFYDVHSAGARVAWRPHPRLSLGVDYTYGVQLERNPTANELIDIRSHIFSALAMFLIDPSFGVDVAASLEYRVSQTAPDVLGPAIEAGVFARW